MSKTKSYIALIESNSGGWTGGTLQKLIPFEVDVATETPLSIAAAATKAVSKESPKPKKLWVIDARALRIPPNWKEAFAPQEIEPPIEE